MISIDAFSGIYSKNELKDYFQTLINAIDNSPDKTYLCLKLRWSLNIEYLPMQNVWVVNNIAYEHGANTAENLANHICGVYRNKNVAMSTRISCVLEDRLAVANLIKAWKSDKRWQDMHVVTKEKANLGWFNDGWLYYAVDVGDVATVKDLLKRMPFYKKDLTSLTIGGIVGSVFILVGIPASFAVLPLGLTFIGLGVASYAIAGGFLLAADKFIIYEAERNHVLHEGENLTSTAQLFKTKLSRNVVNDLIKNSQPEEVKDNKISLVRSANKYIPQEENAQRISLLRR